MTMLNQLEKSFFPFVEKPTRYIGQEIGLQVKEPQGRFNIALAYPDLYEIGMSYFGLQILYHLINRRDFALCERVFAPWVDAADLMRKNNIPLFTLESYRPVKEFDLFGFSLSYEMIYTNVLEMLDLAGIPIYASDRGEDDPLIAGGGPICFNPEPMADFIDFFFLGEAEDTIEEFLKVLNENKTKSRHERLLSLAAIDSIYIPRFYEPDTKKPQINEVSETITARKTKELHSEYYPSRPLVPLTEIIHDRVAVEIMRGCPQGCRFCQAGQIYKPVRLRSVADIKKQAIDNLGATGSNELGLLSLSSSDYPYITQLTQSLTPELEALKVSLSLPSLRPSSFTGKLADAASKTHKTGLTFAPEVGTDRMRHLVRKNITEAELLNAVEIAFEKGWQLIKLYFMIGLPNETEEDIEGIAELINKAAQIGRQMKGQRKINVTISPFSPKAHTPFQWDGLCQPDEISKKTDLLKRKIRAREVILKFRNPELSFLEGVIGRGNHALGEVIYRAWKSGARFDGWSEQFNYDIWLTAFREVGIDPNELAKDISFSSALPWDHVNPGRSREQLQQERSKASKAAADDQLMPETSSDNGDIPINDSFQYGRRKRKLTAANTSTSPMRGKIRLKWGKSGLVRFMSHLDNNRIFERAIRRSGLPVVYSRGFHPHQKLSFGPPLPVGYSSECEFMDIHIDGLINDDHFRLLRNALPTNFEIYDYKLIFSKAPAISTLLNRAIYNIRGEFGSSEILGKKIKLLIDKDEIIAFRTTKDGGKEVDIRPAIYRLELIPDIHGFFMEMELGLGQGGYAKPDEVLRALELYTTEEIASFHFHRKALLYRDENESCLDPLTAVI